MIKLAIIVSHPIQYYSPVFKELSNSPELQVHVFYCWNPDQTSSFDHGFKKDIVWDIPLLKGYEYSFSYNKSADPGTHHFYGLDNPHIIDEINQYNADAILIYGWKFKTNLNILKYFKNTIPLFFRGDSHLLDIDNIFQNELKNVILRWVYRKIDYAFYVGINNKNYFKEAGLEESQLIWAPHSIENERFNKTDEEYEKRSNELKFKLNIKKSDTIVLFAGKFEEKKQPLVLLDIAKQFAGSNLHFLFVGNGKFEEEIIKASNEFENIHFLPFQNQLEMPVIYRTADIFCLPSLRDETWGLAVNEAMACSRAIIVSNKVGCAADLVKNGENGFVYNVNNNEELKQILELLKDEKQLLTTLGKNSAEIIDNWSIKKQADAIERGIRSKLSIVNANEESFSITE